MNCLSYALQFWNKNPKYKIYYNHDHCINSNTALNHPWLEINEYGLNYFKKSFSDLLNEQDKIFLEEYFRR